jgi:hypothetical protein
MMDDWFVVHYPVWYPNYLLCFVLCADTPAVQFCMVVKGI